VEKQLQNGSVSREVLADFAKNSIGSSKEDE